MREPSSAITDSVVPEIPSLPSPSMYARTLEVTRLFASAPAPLALTAATPPPETAAEPEKTIASIACSAIAVILISPAASTLESSIQACTSAASKTPSGVQPIKFLARATPIETPTPATPPPPTAREAATIVASISELCLASMVKSPVVVTSLRARNAWTSVRITFVARAPAPLIATPATPPIAADTEAAIDKASMLAFSLATMVTSPLLAVTPPAMSLM